MEPSVTSARIPGRYHRQAGLEPDVPSHREAYVCSALLLTKEQVRSLTNSSLQKVRHFKGKKINQAFPGISASNLRGNIMQTVAQLWSHTGSLLVGLTHRATQRENRHLQLFTLKHLAEENWKSHKLERHKEHTGFQHPDHLHPFKVRSYYCVRHECFRKWLPLLSGLLAPSQLYQAQCQKAQCHHLKAGALRSWAPQPQLTARKQQGCRSPHHWGYWRGRWGELSARGKNRSLITQWIVHASSPIRCCQPSILSLSDTS